MTVVETKRYRVEMQIDFPQGDEEVWTEYPIASSPIAAEDVALDAISYDLDEWRAKVGIIQVWEA